MRVPAEKKHIYFTYVIGKLHIAPNGREMIVKM